MRWDLSRMLIFIRHNFHLCILPLSCCALQFTEVKMITIILYSFKDTIANLKSADLNPTLSVNLTAQNTDPNPSNSFWDTANLNPYNYFETYSLRHSKKIRDPHPTLSETQWQKNLNPNPTLSETHSGKESQSKSYSFWNTQLKGISMQILLFLKHSGKECQSKSYSFWNTVAENYDPHPTLSKIQQTWIPMWSEENWCSKW